MGSINQTDLSLLTVIICILPLSASIAVRIIGPAVKWSGKIISISVSVLLTLISGFIFFMNQAGGLQEYKFIFAGSWVHSDTMQIDFSLFMDEMSSVFLLCIHLCISIILLTAETVRLKQSIQKTWYASIMLLSFSLTGIIISENLVLLYLFWMLAGVSGYFIIETAPLRNNDKTPGILYFIPDILGSMMVLFGLLILQYGYGIGELSRLREVNAGAGLPFYYNSYFLFGSFIAAVLVRSAQFPFHIWLPFDMKRGHSVLLYIVLLCILPGAYVLLRIVPFIAEDMLQFLTIVISAVSAVAAVIAAFQISPFRIVLYLTISETGYSIATISSGLVTAGLIHVFTLTFSLIIMIVITGSIGASGSSDHTSGKTAIKKKILPGILFVLAGASLTGLPLTAGFPGKSAVFLKNIAGFESSAAHIFPITALSIVILLSGFNVSRLFCTLFCAHAKGKAEDKSGGSVSVLQRILLVLSALCLVPVLYTLPSVNPLSLSNSWIGGIFSKSYSGLQFPRYAPAPFQEITGLTLYSAGIIVVLISLGVFGGYRIHKKLTALNGMPPAWTGMLQKGFYVSFFIEKGVGRGTQALSRSIGMLERAVLRISFLFGAVVDTAGGLIRSGEHYLNMFLLEKLPLYAASVKKNAGPFRSVSVQYQLIISMAVLITIIVLLFVLSI